MIRVGTGFVRIVLAAAFVVAVLPLWRLAAEELAKQEETAIRAAVEHVAPSVVRIETLGGMEKVGGVLLGTGPTSGLVVSEDGYIITSRYNFAAEPASVLVVLPGGARAPARVVASDHSRMLVLLKVDMDSVPDTSRLIVPEPVPLGDIRVGAWAVAVGRTYDQPQPNVSVGIVSGLSRIWGKAVQTDAKISPNNYGGPLIDIRGRVFGVLVPLSPQATDELSGAEWYDSGIGFAVPLEHILQVLPRLKQGKDLRSGLMGLSLRGSDLFVVPPDIAACLPGSPAHRAGLKAGDRIVSVNGQNVANQAQLKQIVGPLYAGDAVRLTVERGPQRVEAELELVAELAPYEHPFLGVLPVRNKNDGVVVRHVIPESPAALAELKPDDVIVSLSEKKLARPGELAEALSALGPGEPIKLGIRRGSETFDRQVTLGRLPEEIPGDVPPPRRAAELAAPPQPPATGEITFKIPEFANDCMAYVPETYHPDVPHGVVVWLQAPGRFQKDELVARWKGHCEARDLILLAPQAQGEDRWQRDEVAFVGRVLDEIRRGYSVDPTRVVVHGHQGGGAMAYLVAFAHRDAIRGVAVVDSPLPAGVRPPENEPPRRLAVYVAATDAGPLSARMDAEIKQIRDMKHPVTVRRLGPVGRYLKEEELDELVRWIDSLDRL